MTELQASNENALALYSLLSRYIQNILNYNIFIEKKLLLTVNLRPEAEKFISSLDKSIKDEKCYMTMMKFYSNPKAVPFRSEVTSIGMKQRRLILKTI